MWIVRLALRRPYTFVVFALLLLILGPVAILRTPTDIFPDINIPIVTVIWNYGGLSAEEMANRLVTPSERSMTTTVNDIEHIESQTLSGLAIIKVYFQPHVNVANAVAQITAVSQTQLRQFPPGTNPPFIITYSASSVPILQLALSGQGLNEQQLNDFGVNFIRTQLATVQGASIPFPYGGRMRQVQVDLDLTALQAKKLSPSDVVNAISAQNIILPAGTLKLSELEYAVETNSSSTNIQALNDLPIRTIDGSMVYVHDVAHVRDGSPPQTNIVRVDGQRAALMTIQKTGSASTLDIIGSIRKKLPMIKSQLPPQLKIDLLSDQSIFVRSAISGVVREGIIAACLTGVMILLFLGSWRSTIIIAVSIPLSILSSIIVLSALGETINIMTLGGLALAVGILVDDATVAIENINRNLEGGKVLEQAIIDGSAEIAIPAFVSTLAICIVFVPMFFLGGVARYLFVPLAEAVVFAMLASYLLSRTLVPSMALFLLKEHDDEEEERKLNSRNPWTRFQLGFENVFARIRNSYTRLLELCVMHATVFLTLFVVFCLGSAAVLAPWLGRDFFPSVDSGQFKLHLRARTGTRIEETANLCDRVDQVIRREIPPSELNNIIDNVGIPYSGLNLSYSNSAPVGPGDADILVSLAKEHKPTDEHLAHLRTILAQEFPGVIFYTLPVDIVTQILNFGLSSPIDIQVVGPNLMANRAFAEKLMNEIKFVPGTAGIRIQQPFDSPKLYVNVDRTKAQDMGLAQRDVAGNLLVALSGSFQTSPSFWLNPQNGVSYNIAVQAPQYSLDTLQDLKNIPITRNSTTASGANTSTSGGQATTPSMGGKPIQILGNLATITRGSELATVSHYDVQPVIDIYANVVNSDLGSVDKQIEKILDAHRKELPRGSQISVRGEVETMRTAYTGLIAGLIFSILFVYLLIVVNFQSWLDPLIIIGALPAALAGIVWFLFVTHTRLSVPALTGAIMCMGVATANSILVVSFAREQLEVMVGDARRAAIVAGSTRFRPVIMTALAMIIGMVPMALGMGDGGEQNAPLGRAVIGGLLFATVATLLFVPTFFSAVHGAIERRRRQRAAAQKTDQAIVTG
ncbi:MAG TPA: efflux RND transporter permease subunit [Acidisarcina sp.]|nr:efflux RND transporter permease subunit [Acidisarcina sp.]